MIDIDVLRAAGLTDAQIIKVIETEQRERKLTRREQARIRQQNHRSRNANGSYVRDERDSVTSVTPSSSPSPSSFPPIPPHITTPSSPPPASSLRSEGRSRAKRLSEEWTPSDEDFEFAHSKGLQHARIAGEAEKFRNYWTAKSGQGATKVDWSATWRNWILNTLERNGGPPNGHRPNNLAQRAFDLADQIRERELAAGIGRSDAAVGSGGDRGEVDILLPERR